MSTSSEVRLLSDLLAETEGYPLPRHLDECCRYAAEIQLAKNPTAYEKDWIKDFNLHIAEALKNSRELSAMVAQRKMAKANPENRSPRKMAPSTSKEIQSQETCQHDVSYTTPQEARIEPTEEAEAIVDAINFPPIEENIQQQNSQIHQHQASSWENDNIIRNMRENFDSSFSSYGDVNEPKKLPNNRMQTELNTQHSVLKIPPLKPFEVLHKPHMFDGNRSEALHWIELYESCALANNWDERYWSTYVGAYLKDGAQLWLTERSMPDIGRHPKWNDFKINFIRTYIGANLLNKMKVQLNRTYQKPNQPITDFIPRILKLLKFVFPSNTEEENVVEIRSRLLKSVREKIISSHCSTIKELNDVCIDVEDLSWGTKQLDLNKKDPSSRFIQKNFKD